MIIRFPRTFKLSSPALPVVLSIEDTNELINGFPGEVTLSDTEVEVAFDSPHAAADFVDSLENKVPFLASNMTLEEEIVFTEVLAERTSARPTRGSHSKLSVAALCVAIPSAAIAIAALVLGIVGVAI
jgi:hypothetical protein